MPTRLTKNERGAALIETAITIPVILLISVGIFEFGRAYQTWQVLTNASREGARQAILTDRTDADVRGAVENYLRSGGLPCVGTTVPKTCRGSATVNINRSVPFGPNTASQITVDYPFDFIFLNPVLNLVKKGPTPASARNMQSVALMRNES
jgi:Flp pilus assembly protein TadG